MSDAVTFVCAIEAGRLEAETLLMVQSLRTFGGGLATAPVIAVTGRRGPALARATVERLSALNVRIVHAPYPDNRYPWFGYANKIMAIVTANAIATTPTVAWLDSDVLIAAEPTGLVMREREDIALRVEPLYQAVTYDDTTNAPYWRALCAVVGADHAAMPWLEHKGVAQMAYFNSGVFAWRRESGFATAYRDAFWRLLDSRIAQRDGAFFSADQVILSPLVAKLGLRWRHLDQRDHHIVFPPLLDEGPSLAGSAVLHYSGSLRGENRPRFLTRLHDELPAVARWLEGLPQEPAGSDALRTLHMTALRRWRGLQWKLYARRVRPITA